MGPARYSIGALYRGGRHTTLGLLPRAGERLAGFAGAVGQPVLRLSSLRLGGRGPVR